MLLWSLSGSTPTSSVIRGSLDCVSPVAPHLDECPALGRHNSEYAGVFPTCVWAVDLTAESWHTLEWVYKQLPEVTDRSFDTNFCLFYVNTLQAEFFSFSHLACSVCSKLLKDDCATWAVTKCEVGTQDGLHCPTLTFQNVFLPPNYVPDMKTGFPKLRAILQY